MPINKRYINALLSRNLNPDQNYAFADFETYITNGKHNVICYSVYDDKYKYVGNVKMIPEDFVDIESASQDLIGEFIQDVLLLRKPIIYFHNGSKFDLIFILNYLTKEINKYKVDVLSRDNYIYKIKIVEKKSKLSVELRDSFHLLPLSLDKLAKSIGKEKDSAGLDAVKFITASNLREKEYRKIILNYCLKDSILLAEVFHHYNQILWNAFKVNLIESYTIASLAMKCYRTNYYDENSYKIYIPTENEDAFIRNAYYGGKVEVYRPHESSSLYIYDVNSLYPYAMLKNYYPVEHGIFIDVNKYLEDKEDIQIGFYEVDVVTPTLKKMPIPFLVHRDNKLGGLLSPLGNFSGVYFSEELKYAVSLGYKIYLKRGYVFYKKAKIFENYVNTIYNERIKHKSGDPMNIICKLLLNSLYGKFGMAQQKTITEIVNKEKLSEILVTKDKVNYHEINHGYLVKYSSKINEENLTNYYKHNLIDKSTYYNSYENQDRFDGISAVQIAAAITAYSRIEMDKYIRKYTNKMPSNLYYTDTDSIVLYNKIDDSDLSDTEIGKLKLEAEIRDTYFLAPKVYSYKIYRVPTNGINTKPGTEIRKIAGIPQHEIPENIIRNIYYNEKVKINYNNTFYRIFNALSIYIKRDTKSIQLTTLKRKRMYTPCQGWVWAYPDGWMWTYTDGWRWTYTEPLVINK